ncbi:hypothetical protein MNBD_ALPHA09-692 [hydrothermal vent metagenome]|uniref:TRAP transporter solute receptor, TAXI family n=1 Tax=hydrothermal vent metagenome TaxID=652676 RepID=A0A3B0TGS3_9ZZZZ
MLRFLLIVIFALSSFYSSPLVAQNAAATSPQLNETDRKWLVNKGTVGVVSGGIRGTYVQVAADLSAVLDDGNKLRIIPMIGKGSVQNITDILYLKGTDIGIVQSDVLTFIKDQGIHGGIERRIKYITKLYNEEFHLVANKAIRSIEELAGRQVNFGNEGSGTDMTAQTVFKALGIDVVAVYDDYALALEKVKSGETAAMVYVAGKPVSAFTPIGPDDNVHFLPVRYEGGLRKAYLPSSFTSDDYPGLVPLGQEIETIAVGAIMAVFNWQPGTFRYNKVKHFVNAMFSNFDKFQLAPRHKKWREVNLAAEVPGWRRFKPAADWLARNPLALAGAGRQNKTAFERFISQNGAANLSAAEMQSLFKAFLEWQKTAGRS